MTTNPANHSDHYQQSSVTFPRIICIMRIRNEERWLKDVLDSIGPAVSGIVVLDDGSTDNTPQICHSHPAVVDYHRIDKPIRDQTRDKNLALQLALKQQPDWILNLDGDEMLESSAASRILHAIRTCPDDVAIFRIESLFMWNDMRHYRTDGIYHRLHQERMFKLAGQDIAALRYLPTKYRENGHCTRLPAGIKGREIEIDVKILHLGYMYEDVRRKRYERYRQRDPEEFSQGHYEHLLDQPSMILAEWSKRPPVGVCDPAVLPTSITTHKQEIKPEYYYANARRNLVELVPKSARNVLDVGCGQGMTGGLLRAERGIEVVGIEIHPSVAEVAREHLMQVVVGDLETMDLPFPDGYFDCILMGDVLEHLIDPWSALKKLTRILHQQGTIVASIPNIRNLGIMKKLLEGSWTYEEWGILDKTHLRFFAMQDMIALFEQAGIEVTLAEVVRDPLFEKEMATPPQDTTNVDLGKLLVRAVPPDELNELTAQQFIFTGKLKAISKKKNEDISPADDPEVSVIIPVFNNLQYTRQCITSLFTAKESVNFEVIVVDNGSSDGTAEFLAQLPPAIRTITFPENRGFAKGCNAGVNVARGRYLVFLNNDTIVQPGWLTAMVECMQADSTIGLVGNLQIFADSGKVQQAGIVCGPDQMVYSIYHNQLPADHPAVNKEREFQFVAGSCMLVEREFFAQISGFDEAYLNSCEDVDLCMKVREAGRKVYYCPKSRIFHFESKTATGHPKDSDNYRRFLLRWKTKLIRDDLDYLRADGFLEEAIQTNDNPKEETMLEIEEHKTLNEDMRGSLPKIALLSTFNQHCGLANYAESLVRELRQQGLDPIILAEKTTDLRGPEPANVKRCWTRDPNGGAEIPKIIRSLGIEVLHVNHGGMFALDGWLPSVLTALRAQGVRIVTTFHATETLAPELGAVARLSDQIIGHHPQNELELIAIGGPLGRFEYLPIGMSPVARTDIFECKLKLGWDPAQKVVSTFGFLDSHKGVLELIQAMKPVHQHLGAQLHVLGGPHPANPDAAEYMERCRQRANELGMARSVTFTGEYLPDEEVSLRLQASDAIVLNYQSLRYEGSSAAMVALASGRPVITSSAPSFEFLKALTFKLTQEFNLPQAIYFVLTNPFVARTLLDNVLNFEKSARWDVIAKRHLEIYRGVQSRPTQSDVDLMKFYKTHPDEIYAEPLQRERVRWLKNKAEGRILEIGPATGYVSQFVGANTAVDINRGRLAVCEALRPETKFMYGNVVEGLSFKDKEFDQVHAPEILEHVDFDQAVTALRECARVGKRLLITLPNSDKPYYNPDLVHNVEHRWLVNRQSVERLLKEAECTDYELDCSTELDFYLLDIRMDTGVSKVQIHERAALLGSPESESSEAVQIAVDMSVLESEDPFCQDVARYTENQFQELMRVRPDWSFTLLGQAREPSSEMIKKLTEHENARYVSWNKFSSQDAEVLYLPHPMNSVGREMLEAAKNTGMFIACTFADLFPLAFADEVLNPHPEFKASYLAHLQLLRDRCNLFLCWSQTTVQDLQARLQIPKARLRTLHGAAEKQFDRQPRQSEIEAALRKYGLSSSEFVLLAGVPDQRQNIEQTLLAVAAARHLLVKDLRLVVAGEVPPAYSQHIRQLASECTLPDASVILTGKITDDALNVLYRAATALLHPCRYEGLGLPILNAMSAGLPVIAGNNSAQAELFEDAALLVDVDSPESIARAILDIIQNPQLSQELRDKGSKAVQRFSWRKVAEKTAMYLSESMRWQSRIAKRNAPKRMLTGESVVA